MSFDEEEIAQREYEERRGKFLDENCKTYPGGIKHPKGYGLMLTIPVDDGSINVQLEGLLRNQELEIRSQGITINLDRPSVNSPYGRLHGRIIHDFIGTIYVFRQDRVEEGLSHFIVEFAHQ